MHLACAPLKYPEQAVISPECKEAQAPRTDVQEAEDEDQELAGLGHPPGDQGQPEVPKEAFARGSEDEYKDMVGVNLLKSESSDTNEDFWQETPGEMTWCLNRLVERYQGAGVSVSSTLPSQRGFSKWIDPEEAPAYKDATVAAVQLSRTLCT